MVDEKRLDVEFFLFRFHVFGVRVQGGVWIRWLAKEPLLFPPPLPDFLLRRFFLEIGGFFHGIENIDPTVNFNGNCLGAIRSECTA